MKDHNKGEVVETETTDDSSDKKDTKNFWLLQVFLWLSWFPLMILGLIYSTFFNDNDMLGLFLWSMSPFGEAKVSIPFLVTDSTLQTSTILLVGIFANLLVFPLLYKSIEICNKYLLRNKLYKSNAVKLSLRARRKTKNVIGKYGAWGLMIFVMVPIPFTGAYIGTIASYIFGINYKKSIIAISIGIVGSSIMVAYGTEFIKKMLM